MSASEQRAQQIIKQHISIEAPSYQQLLQRGYYGYMDFYLSRLRNDETMSTTADFNVTMLLAQIDQFWNHIIPLSFNKLQEN